MEFFVFPSDDMDIMDEQRLILRQNRVLMSLGIESIPHRSKQLADTIFLGRKNITFFMVT